MATRKPPELYHRAPGPYQLGPALYLLHRHNTTINQSSDLCNITWINNALPHDINFAQKYHHSRA
jgi:hypothetical protein